MFSISEMNIGQEAYYASLAVEDYYTKGGEPQGNWYGKGAARLGLGEKVEPEQLSALFLGYTPTGNSLVQHQQGKDRQPGWDLTFSAPKSVSVLWSSLPPGEHRDAIAKAHDYAVKTTLDYLEEAAIQSRRGAGGKRVESADCIFALHEHGTSRAADEQLHTHALCINAGYRHSDGTWGALVSHPLFEEFYFTAGSMYRMTLATQIEEIGYETVPRNEAKLRSFEVKCVPRALCEERSKRRNEIEAHIEEHGLEATGRNKAYATMYTRSYKGHIARGELFDGLRKEASEKYGFAPTGPERAPNKLSEQEQWAAASAAAQTALSQFNVANFYFTEADLLRRTADQLQVGGVSPQVLIQTVQAEIKEHTVEIQNPRARFQHYSAPSTAIATERLVGEAHEIRKQQVDGLDFAANEVQLQLAPQALQCVETTETSNTNGHAKQLAAQWVEQGFRVHGITPSRSSATQFEKSTGIKSQSVNFALGRLSPQSPKQGSPTKVGERATRLGAAAVESGWAIRDLKLTSKDILVIAKADTMHPSRLADVLKEAKEANAKVVAFGQRDKAGVFRRSHFTQLLDASPTTLAPDKPLPGWRHIANIQLAEGDFRSGVSTFVENGATHFHHTGDITRQVIARACIADRKSMAIGADQKEVDLLNRAAQKAHRASLSRPSRVAGWRGAKAGGTTFYKGDRVLFERGNLGHGYRAGERATIERFFDKPRYKGPLTDRFVTIKLDEGHTVWSGFVKTRRVTMPVKDLEHVKLGYAVIPYMAEQLDVDSAHVHVTPGMDAQTIGSVSAPNASLYASYSALGEDLEACHRIELEQPTALEEARLAGIREKIEREHEVVPEPKAQPQQQPAQVHQVQSPAQQTSQAPQPVQQPGPSMGMG